MARLGRVDLLEATREFLPASLAKARGTIQYANDSRQSNRSWRGHGGGIRRASCGKTFRWTRLSSFVFDQCRSYQSGGGLGRNPAAPAAEHGVRGAASARTESDLQCPIAIRENFV